MFIITVTSIAVPAIKKGVLVSTKIVEQVVELEREWKSFHFEFGHQVPSYLFVD